MACGCSKKRTAAQPRRYNGTTGGGTTQAFSLIKRDGTTMPFGSRLEADAENARQGYTGIVRQNSQG